MTKQDDDRQQAGTAAAGAGGRTAGRLGGALAALALLAVLFGWWSVSGSRTGPAAPPASPAATPQAPDAVAGMAGAPATAPAAPDAPRASDLSAPSGAAASGPDVVSYDLLRAAPDGTVTLAGHAAPGARVEVLIDGLVIDTVTAGADGSFVSLQSGAPAAVVRQMQVRVTGTDGTPILSRQSLTVAPSPLAVAEAATAAGATPEQVAAQVAAAQQLAAAPLVTDATGAHVLAGTSEALTVDTLASDPAGRVQISGRGAPRGTVLRAYVDNVESGLTSPGDAGGWQMALPAPKPGTHMLRVDALDAQGKVVGRAEQTFDTAAPEVTATATAPATATDIVTTPEGVVSGGGGTPRVVTITRGTTLWAIARDTYGDPLLYVRVFEANKSQIRDPDLIYPGQVFTLPQ